MTVLVLLGLAALAAAVFGVFDVRRYWHEHPRHVFHPARRPATDRDVAELCDAIKWGVFG